jgi:DNA polymerase III subunit epsilon
MYAIVDIETTGGHASANGITEIAILLHDGSEVVEEFQTLINPGVPIPIYITALTGINDEMVRSAPSFKEVAAQVFSLLQGKIFVAHNVNFDYSFIRHHLLAAGFDLQLKKLCTVRLGRKLMPGYASYSLGRLCKCLDIEGRHRAAGDARATAKLFDLLVKNDTDGYIQTFLNKKSREQQLPPHLNKADIDTLPSCAGVYYFKDNKGKAIYVGKAVNLKKRVISHFSGNNSGKQRQEFLKNIYTISYQECGTELMSLILEASEIRRLWPENNRALKRFELSYGLFMYEDQRGYLRLMIDKKKKHSSPEYSFNQISEGHNLVRTLMQQFDLCPKLCFIQRNTDECIGVKENYCKGACCAKETVENYNERVRLAISSLKASLPTFALVDQGRKTDESSLVLMEEGQLKGMGYFPNTESVKELNQAKSILEPCSSTEYLRNLVMVFATKFPDKVIYF